MRSGFSFGVPFSPLVKNLVITNVAIWFAINILLDGIFKLNLGHYLSLIPGQVLFDYWLWQPLTYMFVHSTSVMHIVFNMLMLWFMGSELENRWGSKFFLKFYLFTGVGAGLIYCLGSLFYSLYTGTTLTLQIPVVGSSGAIFGLLLAYGIIFSERELYFFMLFPIKAKYFVLIMGLIELANLVSNSFAGAEVAYLAHLGGLISGFVYLRLQAHLSARANMKKNTPKSKAKLRLVVDNDDKSKSSSGPKYWN